MTTSVTKYSLEVPTVMNSVLPKPQQRDGDPYTLYKFISQMDRYLSSFSPRLTREIALQLYLDSLPEIILDKVEYDIYGVTSYTSTAINYGNGSTQRYPTGPDELTARLKEIFKPNMEARTVKKIETIAMNQYDSLDEYARDHYVLACMVPDRAVNKKHGTADTFIKETFFKGLSPELQKKYRGEYDNYQFYDPFRLKVVMDEQKVCCKKGSLMFPHSKFAGLNQDDPNLKEMCDPVRLGRSITAPKTKSYPRNIYTKDLEDKF